MQMAMEPSSSITSIANENNLIFAADSKAGAEDTGVSGMPNLPQDVALEISHPAMETDSGEIEWYDDLADALTGEKRCDLSVVRKITNCGIFPERLRLSAWHACLGNAPDPSFVLSVKSNTVQNDVIPDSISILIDQKKAKRNTADPYDADTRRLFAAILSSLSAGPVNESPLNSRELQAEFVAALTVVHDVVIKADAQSNHESPSKEVCMRSLFVSVLDFIPSNINSALQLLRLIIQYHDPELSLFLDSKKLFVPAASSKSRSVAADSTYGSKQPPHKMVFERWLLSLLSSDAVTFDAVIPIWDMYFQHHDPYLIFFVILVLLINIKDTLLSQSFESTEAIETVIVNTLRSLEPSDVPDCMSLAQFYSQLTPSSFRACCYSELFESVKTANPGTVSVAASVALMPKEQARSGKSQQQPLPRNSSTNNLETKPYYYKSNMHIPVDQALCLPVTAEELLESLYMPDDATAGGGSSMGTASNASNSSMSTAPAPTTLAASTSALKFFIIDCRSSDDYNECHLSMAFHLEASLICTDPVNFSTALDTLLQHQSEVTAASNSGNALVGEHICFLGYGTDPLTTSSAAARDQHDQYMFMVQSRLLQRGKKMISSLDGGFAEIMLYCSELDLVGREELLHGSDVHKHLAPPKSPSRSQPQQQQQALRGPGGQTQQGWGKLFKNLVSQVKHQAEEYKEKLETYMDPYIEAAMRSPSSAGTDDGSPDRYDEENVDRRGGRLDNVGRPMLMSLRSVTSETEEGLSPTRRRRQQQQRRRTSDAGNYEYVNMNDFLRRIDNHLIAHFRAGEILHALSEVPPVPCTLVLTRTQLIIMRHLTAQQQEQFEGHHINGTIVARRSLDAVVKITAKKQCPEVVTIKYGTVDGDEFYITDMDRFFIPEAKNAVDQIKHAVLTLCESLDKGEKSGDDGDAEGGNTSSVDVEKVEMTESSMEVMDEPNAAKKPEILSVHGSTSAPSLNVEMPENSQSNRVLATESGEQMQTLSASATGGQQLKKPLEQTARNVTEAGSGDAGRSAVTSSPRPLTKKQKAAKQQERNTQSSAEMRSLTGSGVGGDGMTNSNNDDGLFSI